MKTNILLLAALALVSACGFRPLYAGQSSSSMVSGNRISVGEIDGRAGYALRQELIRELATGLPGVDGSAQLTVTLSEGITRAALLPDGAVSRSFIEATGFYVLATDDQTLSGDVSVQVPYAATLTPYADVSAQQNASERAMSELARRIVDTLRVQAQQAP